jgi:predicted amidophosphoribosyltransferase
MAARLLAELLATVVPPACLACRTALPRAELRLCPSCTRALPWLPARRCRRCGLPSHRRGGCPAAAAAFARSWAPLAHQGVARDVVAALKFRAALPVASLMAAQIAANLPADLRRPGSDAAAGSVAAADSRAVAALGVVPVPSQPARRRRRGFDPAGALARELAPRLGLPERTCLCRRDRDGRQVGASRAQRRRARPAIELRAPPPPLALLVDDVHTTGATLDACARALLAGGCREVVALSYTRTL